MEFKNFRLDQDADGILVRSATKVTVTPMPPSSRASASPLPEEERMATLKPSCASRRALSAPMPRPPAVMIATF